MKFLKKSPHFKVLSRKTIFKGRISRLDLVKILTTSGRRFIRELIRHPGAVVIIPKLPNGKLLLVHQLRVATGKTIWEFPAGTLEKGEAIGRCAKRELLEETGWAARRMRKLIQFFPTPGISNEMMYLFMADQMKKMGDQDPDPDEELEVGIFSVSQVERMIRTGKIIDGKTILGFLYFLKYKSER